MIGVVDYGVGNIQAFVSAYQYLGMKCEVVNSPENIDKVSHLILPGVGSFDRAVMSLRDQSFDNALNVFCSNPHNKLLGVCIGMHLLAGDSEEGQESGLSLVRGSVKKLSAGKGSIPHMGWNSVAITVNHPLLQNLGESPKFYFLHSYFFDVVDSSDSLGVTNYIDSFSSIIANNNIFGVQFHPEKSHDAGLQLLSNFAMI